jgi:hypothetical protein
MIRSVIGVILGVLVGSVLVFVVESFGHRFFPAPAGFDPTDPAAVKSLPFATKFTVIVAWFAGAFGGGAAAALAGRRWAPAVWVVAATVFLFAVTNFTSYPHPLWMMLASAPATLLGGWLAVKATGADYHRPPAPPTPKL